MRKVEQKLQTIRNLMEYAVPDGRMDEAEDLLDVYRNDTVAQDLLHEFYSYLPEGQNDWVREIRMVARSQGMFLLAAITKDSGFLYLISGEGIEFQGVLADGLWDKNLLQFFGYESREKFREKNCAVDSLAMYEPMDSNLDICPACHVGTGEFHELGCPVEVCPWCGGQLVHCSCRFEKLEIESLATEEELGCFEEILVAQGRIAYSPEQRPSFADDGPGVISE